MKTLSRILLLLIFVILILMLCRCSQREEVEPVIPEWFTTDEVKKHMNGTNEIRYEQGADYWHYIIYMPDGSKGIIRLSIAREMCILFNGKYCEYKNI